MSSVRYLTVEDLLSLAELLGAQVRDVGLLSSSAHRPQSGMFGQDAYPTIWAKAAALMQSIDQNQALLDGNKRLAWVAMETFFELDGYFLAVDNDAAYELSMAVARGESLEKIAETLEAWAAPDQA